jgi:hypothetical protein
MHFPARLALASLWLLGSAASLDVHAISASPTTCGFCGPPPCTARPMAIQNAGFQSGQLAPWTVDYGDHESLTNFSVVQVAPPNRALRVDSYVHHFEYDGQPFLEQHNLTLCPTNQYNMTFDYQVLKSYPGSYINADVLLRAESEREPGFGVGGASVPSNVTTRGWQHAHGLVNNYYLQDVFVAINVEVDGQAPRNMDGPVVLVDNVAVRPIKSLIDPQCPRAPGPLTNNHFQAGNLAPWKVLSIEPELSSFSVVSDSSSDGQPHALRVQYISNSSGIEVNLHYPFNATCLGYVYVFELAYNVITPMLAPVYDDAYFYLSYMPGCGAVNATKAQTGTTEGNLPFNVTGPGTIKTMCRMRHNDLAVYKMSLDISYPGSNATVDFLGLNVRFATATDFESSS